MAPVKAPRSWPKSSASSKPEGIAAQLTLTKVRSLARAEIVDGSGDDFFAGAGFTQNQNSCARGRDQLHLRERAADRGAVADDLFKIICAANFLFEVELFLGELVFQRVDFFEGQGVFDGDGDLRGDLLHQLDILCAENIHAAAREVQSAKSAAPVAERNAANRLESLGAQEAHDFAGILVEIGAARR